MNKKLKVLTFLMPLSMLLNTVSCGNKDKEIYFQKFNIECLWGEKIDDSNGWKWDQNRKSDLEFNYGQISNILFPLAGTKWEDISPTNTIDLKELYFQVDFNENKQIDDQGKSYCIKKISFDINKIRYNAEKPKLQYLFVKQILGVFQTQYNSFFYNDYSSSNVVKYMQIKEGWSLDQDSFIDTEIDKIPLN